MHSSSRFTVAVHTLTLLALEPEQTVTSGYIASSVTTNAVVIRRILGALRKAGLVRSQPGNTGGWRLAREASRISLRDIYRAVEDDPLFAMHTHPPNPHCPVGRHIQQALLGYFGEAQHALEERLGAVAVSDVLQAVQERAAS